MCLALFTPSDETSRAETGSCSKILGEKFVDDDRAETAVSYQGFFIPYPMFPKMSFGNIVRICELSKKVKLQKYLPVVK